MREKPIFKDEMIRSAGRTGVLQSSRHPLIQQACTSHDHHSPSAAAFFGADLLPKKVDAGAVPSWKAAQ
ncbi:hypothetical protein [Janthinobacterium agaricidamnosum]|uniref:Uncharacterized protein n=1 Tax=Janthinobacterium agaricidamnosum NBRC 102515 = DSM 9628 TaxID=1349767 RepID=W0V6K9_9BURK|nr:hypothetical protein [Janthinobacterium agaricidamnosum]CDG82912.1 hypothetical protein GJA_2278 [Janthinobacterium agaricidamnosum NBRC 102515 = DSM 9628]